jgi:hypothetical protein
MAINFFMVETIEASKEQPSFSDLDIWERMGILREAYQEKAYRECSEHLWNLVIDAGSAWIICSKCDGDYAQGRHWEYQYEINLTLPLTNVRVDVYKDYWTQEIDTEFLFDIDKERLEDFNNIPRSKF